MKVSWIDSHNEKVLNYMQHQRKGGQDDRTQPKTWWLCSANYSRTVEGKGTLEVG